MKIKKRKTSDIAIDAAAWAFLVLGLWKLAEIVGWIGSKIGF